MAGARVVQTLAHDQLGLLHGADVLSLPAAGAEPAAGRGVGRARHIALEHDLVAVTAQRRIGHGHGGQQRLRVGVGRALVDLLLVAGLHDLAEVHDRDAVTDVSHDRQVMGDEDVGEPELVLELLEEVDDLGLDGDVES